MQPAAVAEPAVIIVSSRRNSRNCEASGAGKANSVIPFQFPPQAIAAAMNLLEKIHEMGRTK